MVDIERVEVVHLLVGAYGVHVGVDAVARLYIVFCQCQSLPFSQGVHDLSLSLTHVLDREGDRALYAVEVVVDTQTLQDEERGGDTAQPQLSGEVLLEELLDLFDTLFCLMFVEQGLVACWLDKFAHYMMIMLILSYSDMNMYLLQ